MKVVLQRVSRATVTVANETIGRIGPGVAALVGFTDGDRVEDTGWMAEKIVGLRIFADAEGKMNRSLNDVGGEALVVSQFTLYGDTRKGRRPSFVSAAPPQVAIPLYEAFLAEMEERLPGRVARGEFGADMAVELVNDGPVTLVLEYPEA